MHSIGIIGTGIMGRGIALNFLKKSYPVFVWNRTAEKTKELEDAGATICESPREATEKADVVFEVTANDESSRKAWMEDDGILSGATPDKVLIISATLSMDWVDELAGLCKEKGFSFMDMPMTGGREGAEKGELVLLVGGDERLLESIRDDLSTISSQVLWFGLAGSGTRYKLILNMVQGIHMVTLGEALHIAEKVELDVKKVGDALAERPGGVITKLAWRDYQTDPDPINFAVKWIAKDLGYAKKMARDKVKTPLLDETLKKYEKAVENGKGEEDWAIINRVES